MDSPLGDSQRWFALPFTVHAGAGWMNGRWRMTEEEGKQTMMGFGNTQRSLQVSRSMTKRDLYSRSLTASVIYAVADQSGCRIQ